MLAENDISATAFYRWLAESPGFNKRYEEATFIRHRIFGEALIGLSIRAATSDNVRGLLADAQLLERAFCHIMGGAKSWANRRRQQKSSRR